MNFRLANIYDLPKLKVVYGKTIDNMNKNNIQIWDEIIADDLVLYELGFEIETSI